MIFWLWLIASITTAIAIAGSTGSIADGIVWGIAASSFLAFVISRGKAASCKVNHKKI